VLSTDISTAAFVEVAVVMVSVVARAEGSVTSGEGPSATGVNIGVIISFALVSTASTGTIASDERVSTFGISVETLVVFAISTVCEMLVSARFSSSALDDPTSAPSNTSPGTTP
jgi:hypothetical protein